MKRRSAFTFIELLISLGLVAILLTTLFFWMSHLSLRQKALEEQTARIQLEKFADEQLQRLFEKTSLSPHFFTSPLGNTTSLVLMFDRGPASDPLLSNIVLGRLYLDKEAHALCLSLWPRPIEKPLFTPSETLILMPDVSSLEFDFYFPPNPFKKAVDPQEIGKPLPKEGWQGTWQKEYHALPAMIRLKLNGKLFTYELPAYPQIVAFPIEVGS